MGHYPGEGLRMSLNGRESPTPLQAAGLWRNVLQRHGRIHNNHLAIKGDGGRCFPGEHIWTQEEIDQKKDSFYGRNLNPNRPVNVVGCYDRMFCTRYSYNNKHPRDDRTPSLTLGDRFHQEEALRTVPIASSSIYGHRLNKPVEMFERKKVRVNIILKGFYHNCGTGLPPIA